MADGTDGRVRRGRKFEQVLAGAREVFLSDGYEGSSVDDIARAAGVSKATLYSYFPDKSLLFSQVAMMECRRVTDAAVAELNFSMPPERVLRDIADRAIEVLTSDFGRRVFCLCVAESARFPELGRAFYETGPETVRRHLRSYFDAAIARGELRIDDPDLAADQFHELCKADLFSRLIFNIQDAFSAADRARIASGAVATFLARYGAGGRGE